MRDVKLITAAQSVKSLPDADSGECDYGHCSCQSGTCDFWLHYHCGCGKIAYRYEALAEHHVRSLHDDGFPEAYAYECGGWPRVDIHLDEDGSEEEYEYDPEPHWHVTSGVPQFVKRARLDG